MRIETSAADLRIAPRESLNEMLQVIERNVVDEREGLTRQALAVMAECFTVHPNTSSDRKRRLISVHAEMSGWLADCRSRLPGAGQEEFCDAVRELLEGLQVVIDKLSHETGSYQGGLRASA